MVFIFYRETGNSCRQVTWPVQPPTKGWANLFSEQCFWDSLPGSRVSHCGHGACHRSIWQVIHVCICKCLWSYWIILQWHHLLWWSKDRAPSILIAEFFFFLKIRVLDEHLMLIHMMRIAKLKKKSFFSSCCRCSTESRRAILMKHGWSQDFCLPFWLTSSHHKTSWIKSSESSYPASNHIHTWLPRSSSRYYLVPLKWLEKAVSPNCKIASYKGEHERDC